MQNALERGHSVTAFSRSPGKIALNHSRLRLHSGSFHDAADVQTAVPGHDAVIITASASSMQAFKENPNYFSNGTAIVIDAMKKHGVVYFAAVGGAGALIAKRVKEYKVLAYEELGPEAVASMTVEDFPMIVVMDAEGKDFYQVGQAPYVQE